MVSLLISSAIAAISIFALDHEKKSLLEERQLRGKTLVRNLATASAEAILSENELNLFSFCQDIIANETDAQAVQILDQTGKIIAHSNSEMVGKKCADEECESILSSTELRYKYKEFNKVGSLHISAPMSVLDKRIGFVTVVMSNNSINKKLSEIRADIIKLSLIAVIIAIILTFILVHFLVVPIKKLSSGAAIVGTGNFSHRIHIKSKNEIGELAHTFNSMAESLQRNKSQLASLNETSKAINTTIEKESLIKKAMDAVKDIISPFQSILCLYDMEKLGVAAVQGIEIASNEEIDLPEGIKVSILKEKYAVVTSLKILYGKNGSPVVEFKPSKYNEIVLVPMIHEQNLIGYFIVNGKMDGNKFTRADREYLEIIASSTAIAFLNIKLLEETADKARMQAELATAEVVQRTLFPDKPIITKDVEVMGYFKSASETGGDWYNTILDERNNKLYVFIGDVTGHGVPAALNTAAADSFIKTLNLIRSSTLFFAAGADMRNMDPAVSSHLNGLLNPSHVLSLLNKVLYRNTKESFLMTFFSTLIDIPNKKMYFANAGHEMPLVLHSQSKEIEPLISSGVRLGDQKDASYDQYCINLQSGDMIVWYTDGVIECLNNDNEEYGSRRFYRTLKKCRTYDVKSAIDYCVNDIAAFANGRPLEDDITLVVAKFQ